MKKSLLWALAGLILFSSVLFYPMAASAHDVNECYANHQTCRERAFAMNASWAKMALYLTTCDLALGKCILAM
jgi:hypothetical protein